MAQTDREAKASLEANLTAVPELTVKIKAVIPESVTKVKAIPADTRLWEGAER